jgi:hypothetical protein
MASKESLLDLERQLWNADQDFYRETLSDDAVMVFPEPTGILDRDAILESLAGDSEWRRIDFSEERRIESAEDVVQLVYRADAERTEDSSEYSALITTTYERIDGEWRLVSHQQTPLSSG